MTVLGYFNDKAIIENVSIFGVGADETTKSDIRLWQNSAATQKY